MSDELSLSGRVHATDGSAAVAGYRVSGSLTRRVKVGKNRQDTIDVPAAGSGIVGSDGLFALDIPGEGVAVGPVEVARPDGVQVLVEHFTLEQASVPLALVPPRLLATVVEASTMHEVAMRGSVREEEVSEMKGLSLDGASLGRAWRDALVDRGQRRHPND